ncbi:MBL fold metallo-hydrolase [Dactylosporangium sp. NPDC048998]|uniref:MBL fold metallo-hydrolase n=1 Tax=Dactylosporangium sp. NPDC048998 TaxID=3363976 RepID=UPI0037124FFC
MGGGDGPGPGGPPVTALVEVGTSAYAFVQPGGGWCVNNAGVVVGDRRTLLVDTAATKARALALRDAVAALDPRPPGLIVTTHHHGDHHLGNAVFAPPATVVAHDAARPEMAARGTALRHVWPDVDWGDLPPALPAVTFTDRLTIRLGRCTVQLRHLGPAHTTNDVVAWLPEQRVLYAGDLVLPEHTPFILMGSLPGSIAATEALLELEPAVVVGGHGPVAGAEAVAATLRYLRWLDALARAGRAAGATPLEVARCADLGEFAAWGEPERLVANLHRAYAELAGAAPGAYLPSAAVFPDMEAYHGGPLPCHA